MKISIGHRLFACVLLAILAVAASAIYLLRQNVLASFGDYAVRIELDRLDELSNALARQYRGHGGWHFLPHGDERRDWLAHEMARLQELREAHAAGLAPPAPPPQVPSPPLPAAQAAPPMHGEAHKEEVSTPQPVAPQRAAMPAAPAPPAPPAPPLPPLPPPRVAPVVPGATAGGYAGDLHRRVTLLSAGGEYLAGQPPGAAPQARRAIEAEGRTLGYLAVVRGARPSDAMAFAFLEQLQSSLWIIAAAAVILSALAAVLLAAHFRKPIHRLADAARTLAAGRFDVRLPAGRSDELGELARHFNLLAEQLGSAEASRRQWVADTSHELRTPLAVLRAQLEAVQDGVRPASQETLDAMLRQVLALNRLIDDLYTLARADVGALDCRREPLDLWALAAEQAAAFGERLRDAQLVLEVGPAPAGTTTLADSDRMRQVFANLFENAIRYTAPGGRVRLHGACDGKALDIILDDSAPGVPQDALARLSERFYRVDESRGRSQGGAGLGLALCCRLLEAQGAHIAFAHSPLGGLRVTVTVTLEDA